jgi:hypothetical protein
MKQLLIIISPLLLILLAVMYFAIGIKALLIFLEVIVFIPVFIYAFNWWMDFVYKHFD